MNPTNLDKELENLSIEQLKKLEEDIKRGKIQDLIEKKAIKEELKACAVCGRTLPKTAMLILEFGNQDFRKRASFCAFDCMDYFVINLKEKNKETLTEEAFFS